MDVSKKIYKAETVLPYLPAATVREIGRVTATRRDCPAAIDEIRLRSPGRCALVVGGENLLLDCEVSREELAATVAMLCRGSVYAYRDTIIDGYIPMEGGIRVGICGRARYEHGQIVGVCDVSSLVFRVGETACESADALIRAYEEGIGRGMLICSLPGIGKTTALRALARYIGSGRNAKRVAVVDERCEFSEAEMTGTTVDILRGYGRAYGIEVATRTLAPEIILVDEIGNRDEAAQIASALGGGVPLIATAHAGSIEEAKAREGLAPLMQGGFFSVFAGIRRERGVYSCEIQREGKS